MGCMHMAIAVNGEKLGFHALALLVLVLVLHTPLDGISAVLVKRKYTWHKWHQCCACEIEVQAPLTSV